MYHAFFLSCDAIKTHQAYGPQGRGLDLYPFGLSR